MAEVSQNKTSQSVNEALARKCAEAAFPHEPDDDAIMIFQAGARRRCEAAILSYREKVQGWVAKLQDREWVGKVMHESWSRTKQAQGFHGPQGLCPNTLACPEHPCPMFHADLVPWEQLPEAQKDINRHALDDVLKALALPAPPKEKEDASGRADC